MKYAFLIPFLVAAALSSCDHIKAVGDKVGDLKDLRNKTTDGTSNTGPAVQDIGEADFQTFISQPGKLNIVDFHADWCGPCKQLGPVLSEVIESNSGVARLGKINVDNARQLAADQGVRSIPDVRFYIDGELVHKFTGGIPKEKIESLVAVHSAKIRPTDDSPARPKKDTGTGTAEDPEGSGPPTAKPIEEAIKPMAKDWMPPGMSKQ